MTGTQKTFPHAGKGDLTRGPIGRHLLRLTLPMIWGIFAIISFQLVDTFYVALLGTKPLAALSFTFPVTYTVFSLIMGLSIAMSSVLSRQIGEGNQDRVRRVATHGVLLAFLCGIIMAGLGVLLMNPVFRLMGASPEMMSMIDDYMLIWFCGSIFITTPMVGNAAIRATGDTMVPAVIMTVVAVVNIILDPILIFGLFGFPRMELQGAAIATVFANGCAMIAGLYVLYVHKKLICRDGLHLGKWGDSVKRLGYIAVPAGLTNIIQPLTSAVIVSLLAAYSHQAVAAYGVITRLEAFAFTVIMALAVGMAPIIGQNWGAGRFERVNETLHKAFSFAVGWSLLTGIAFICGGRFIAGLFSDDSAVIDIMTFYFYVVALTYAPGNLVPGWASAFNAMGKPQWSFIMIVVRLLALNIPLAVIGSHIWGIGGIFGAIAVTNVMAGGGFHIWNWHRCRRREQQRAAA